MLQLFPCKCAAIVNLTKLGNVPSVVHPMLVNRLFCPFLQMCMSFVEISQNIILYSKLAIGLLIFNITYDNSIFLNFSQNF